MSSSKRTFAIIPVIVLVLFPALGAGASARKPQQSTSQASSASSTSKQTNSTKKKSKKHHSRREPTQKAPTPERISEIQSALGRGGYYQGEPNGKWDSNTISAMQKFQSESGLESTGKINALSLQKLGLGSEIAGVSAPKPVAPTPSASPASGAPSPAPARPSSPAPSSTTNSASAVKPSTH
jgi:peptidoglycan hydrolase-like protein with peptidoglycan-binding domain